MNQQEILRKIGGIIVELKEQHTYLEANGGSFNELELELFMANANFLTDHIDILKKIYGNAQLIPALPVLTPEKTTPTKPVVQVYFDEEEHLPFSDEPLLKKLNDFPETVETEKAVSGEKEIGQEETVISAQILKEEEPASSTIVDASFIAQNSVPVKNEEVETIFFVEPENLELIEEEQEYPDLQESLNSEALIFAEKLEPIIAEPELPKVISGKPEPVKPEPAPALTLNQRIAAQIGLNQPVIKTVGTSNSVQDLPSLITLNDKLLFVKELFNGYNLAYAEAINILNRYTNFEQAEQFLKANYAEKNNWKDKPATTERFLDLLKQRFA